MAKENEPCVESKHVFNVQAELAKSQRRQEWYGTIAMWLYYGIQMGIVIGFIAWLFSFGVSNPPVNQVLP